MADTVLTDREDLDLLALGRRVRRLRQQRGLTLEQLGALVDRAPSQLSLVENGKREPRLGLLQAIAAALGVPVTALLDGPPPDRRTRLELALERAQRASSYASLGLPPVRTGRRLPLDALEALVGLHEELARQATEHLATPEEARRANAELRRTMRERDNHFPEIEAAARKLLDAVGHRGGPLTQRDTDQLAAHLGFTLHRVTDLPHSTRSVTDLRNRRLYLPAGQHPGGHDPRAIALQALGHLVLGHEEPSGYPDFLRQRVEVNYFAAALLVPERDAVAALTEAKRAKDIAIEDLRDGYAVSYETAAHRFTNLATAHLGITVHFQRVHRSGTLHKGYENDGVVFPADVTGAIEGQPVCRHWTARAVFAQPDPATSFAQYTDTPSGTYWCTAARDPAAPAFSVSVGTPYATAKWFRGRDTTARAASRCPDEACCRRPPEELARRWATSSWPSARAHTHLLAALPPGTFPGVDDTEVYRFLETHAGSHAASRADSRADSRGEVAPAPAAAFPGLAPVAAKVG